MNVTWKNSGDAGDCVFCGPVMRRTGPGTLYLNPNGLPSTKYDGSRSGFNRTSIQFLAPLLEAQPYIEAVKVWNGEPIELDLDAWRDVGYDYSSANVCHTILQHYKVAEEEAERPWLTVAPKRVARYVISRSERYRNRKVNWLALWYEFKAEAVFVGLPAEYLRFCEEVGKVDYYTVKDALELAEVIAGSERLVGNQTLAMAVAVGLHHAYIQEVCPFARNVIFRRPNAGYLT